METPKHKIGIYSAKAADWSITKTNAGLPQVAILFRYMEDSQTQRELIWWGSFKDGAVERTIETLILLGLTGPLDSLVSGCAGSALSTEKPVEIVVEHRSDSAGTLRAGISWVNDPQRRPGFGKVMDKSDASRMLGRWDGLLNQKRGTMSAQTATQNDIPF